MRWIFALPWGRIERGVAAVVGSLLIAPGCVGERAERCSRHTDCETSICSTQGYCEQECQSDRDCPCGSSCSSTCGLCLVNGEDGVQGPATCYAIDKGLSVEEVLGVCRSVDVADAGASSNGGGAGAGDSAPVHGGAAALCALAPVTVAQCLARLPADSTPVVATGGAGGAAGSPLSAGAGGAVSPPAENAGGASGTAGGRA